MSPLAHLAVPKHAEAKYREARELFDRVGDGDAVEVIDRQLVQIEEQKGAGRDHHRTHDNHDPSDD